MEFVKTKIAGLLLIQPTPSADNRGLFARTFCEKTFRDAGLTSTFIQCSTSYNIKRGTVRGMHFQEAPHGEVKVVRCTHGKIWDVIVDARKDSPTYLQWQGFELSAENRHSLYVPEGCGHGFQTLEDNSEVFYMISAEYVASAARGLRWDDPRLRITWPIKDNITIAEKDKSWPAL